MRTDRWEIDSSHSNVHFSVRHLVIAKVRGTFTRWSGTVQVPDGDFSKATVAVTIDATSIDTGVADRDGRPTPGGSYPALVGTGSAKWNVMTQLREEVFTRAAQRDRSRQDGSSRRSQEGRLHR